MHGGRRVNSMVWGDSQVDGLGESGLRFGESGPWSEFRSKVQEGQVHDRQGGQCSKMDNPPPPPHPAGGIGIVRLWSVLSRNAYGNLSCCFFKRTSLSSRNLQRTMIP